MQSTIFHMPSLRKTPSYQTDGGLDTWAINFSALKVSQEERQRITQTYRKFDLVVRPAASDKTAGIFELRQLFASNKLKVFTSLSALLSAYRIGDAESPLLLSLLALVLTGRDIMRTKPVKRSWLPPKVGGDRGWMN